MVAPVVKEQVSTANSAGDDGVEEGEKRAQVSSVRLAGEKPAEKEEYLNELKLWMCVCLNLEDWTAIHNKYSGKALFNLILSSIPSLFAMNFGTKRAHLK